MTAITYINWRISGRAPAGNCCFRQFGDHGDEDFKICSYSQLVLYRIKHNRTWGGGAKDSPLPDYLSPLIFFPKKKQNEYSQKTGITYDNAKIVVIAKWTLTPIDIKLAVLADPSSIPALSRDIFLHPDTPTPL